MKHTKFICDKSMYIQYIRDKYTKNIFILGLEMSCTLYVNFYMINLCILNIHTFCHLQTLCISWKFVIYTKPTGKKHKMLLVRWTENHLSSFKCGFLNIFSRQNLLCSLSRQLFPLRWNKYGSKKCLKNHIPFYFSDDSTLANQEAGETIEKPLNELPWNQQISRIK